VFTREDLIARFTLDGISGGNAVFNPEKLDWFNQQHILRMPVTTILDRLAPEFEAAGLRLTALDESERARIAKAVDLVRPRARKLTDIVALTRPFWLSEIPRDAAAITKHLSSADLRPHLAAWRDRLRDVDPFDAVTLESALRSLAEERGLKPGPLIHATRVAVTGQAVSPGLFDVLELVGRDRAIARLTEAEALLKER
jgi:glutamyl-tRNA synthetase